MTRWDRTYFEARYGRTRFGWGAEARRGYLYRAMKRIVRRAVPAPRVILEIGCGPGYLSKHLGAVETVRLLVAADVSPDALKFARESREPASRVRFARLDGCQLPVRSGSVDVVMALDVVEHLPDPVRMLREAWRVLLPNGVMVLSTPNPGSLGARVKGRHPGLHGRPFEERRWQWFGHRDDTHVSIRSIPAWRADFQATGFTVDRDGTDFWWDAPYVTWLPGLPQEIVCKGLHRILTTMFGFLPWHQGENYLAVVRKRAVTQASSPAGAGE